MMTEAQQVAYNTYRREYDQRPGPRAKKLARCKKYDEANRPYRVEATARSQAKKLGLVPDDACLKLMREFYLEARRRTLDTGIVHHVDHMIPLALGGLHHQDNLQVITQSENLIKGNSPWRS